MPAVAIVLPLWYTDPDFDEVPLDELDAMMLRLTQYYPRILEFHILIEILVDIKIVC